MSLQTDVSLKVCSLLCASSDQQASRAQQEEDCRDSTPMFQSLGCGTYSPKDLPVASPDLAVTDEQLCALLRLAA